MENKVLNTITNNSLINKGDIVAVGLSGGADSTALIYILNKIKEIVGFNISAIHINHMIRGGEALKDEEFVISLCHSLNIPIKVYRRDCVEYSAAHKLGLEESARILRYEVFAKACRELGANKIAVAHNENDNAETLLMRLIRGTSPYGLRGIDISHENIIRPLLYCTREEIECYIEENAIAHITDSSNMDFSYTRNKIRGALIPYLENEYNPNILGAISRLSQNLKTDAAFFSQIINNIYDNYVTEENSFVIINKKLLENEHRAVSERLIRESVRRLTGRDKDFENIHTQMVLGLFTMKSGKKFNIAKELGASNVFGNVAIYKISAQEFKEKKISPGDFVFLNKQWGWLSLSAERPFKQENFKNTYTGVYLCDKIFKNIVLRRRCKGDIIKLSSGKTIKFKDFLIERKIFEFLRDDIFVLACENQIIAVISGINYTAGQRPAYETAHKNEALYIQLWEEESGGK